MNRPLLFVCVISIAIITTGCNSMADAMTKAAGVGVIKEEISTFSNATEISMSPAFLYNPEAFTNASSLKLGARWEESTPHLVALILAYNSDIASGGGYVNFSGLDINIDGEISSHKTSGQTLHTNDGFNTVSRTIYTSSKNLTYIKLDQLNEIINAEDCRLRIHTSNGYEDIIFSIDRIPGGQSTARMHLRDFYKQVMKKQAN